MNVSMTTRYPFALHARRVSTLTIVSGLVFVVFGAIALLSTFSILPASFNSFTVIAYILAFLGLVVFMPLLYFQYGYTRAGVEIGPEEVRVQFPGENAQQMAWPEARFAVDEGEEYLYLSKGKEGLGHLVGDTRYIRLHLEGMMPEQRKQVELALTEHVGVRQPLRFTLMTLLNTKGEIVARGRLYLFENEVLCMENRGEKRVFFYAPLQELSSVKQRASFYIGRLECEAFAIRYAGKDYVVMLGYETTISSNLGTSSHWSSTGNAQEWVEALTSD